MRRPLLCSGALGLLLGLVAGPARAAPDRPLRFGLELSGQLGGVPVAPRAAGMLAPRASPGASIGAYLAIGRFEWVSQVGFSRPEVERTRGPAGTDLSDRPLALFALTGPHWDLEGPADGLGLNVGAHFGLRHHEGEVTQRLADPRCTDCPAVLDWQVEEALTTIAFVPSIGYRARLFGDTFRLDLDLDAMLWLGGRGHALRFSGDSTPEASATFEQLQQVRSGGFYAAFMIDLGVRFSVGASMTPDGPPGGTRTDRPPPSRKEPRPR